jgi:HEAT repeat protein
VNSRGRRVALGAAALGLATSAVTVFILRGRIVEEWHIHRLGNGDDEARQEELGWMAEHGEEASWLAVMELFSRREFLRLHEENRGWLFVLAGAADQIGKRLGPKRLEAAMIRALDRATSRPEVQVLVAAFLFDGKSDQFEPRTFDLAIRRCREYLSNPDPLIRLAAVHVLGKAGERARTVLPALEALKNDAHQDVRQAAVEAIQKISGA